MRNDRPLIYHMQSAITFFKSNNLLVLLNTHHRHLDHNTSNPIGMYNMDADKNAELIYHVADITAAYVGNNTVAPSEVGQLIEQVWNTLSGLGAPPAPATEVNRLPAVSIRASIRNDRITCLHCGRQFKSMKRHIKAAHGETSEEYRRRWGLPHDYPLVAPDYAATRSALALENGLGRRPAEPEPVAPPQRPARGKAKA